MAATNRAIVYGGKGGLGTVIVDHFKSKGWWICSVDIRGNEKADTNVLVNPDDDWTKQEATVCEAVSKLLSENKVDAVINMAGGWAGGSANSPDFIKNADLMWKQSVWSSTISAALASKHLKAGGCLVLPGAQPALKGTAGMMGYGMAKAAVHQLAKSLSDPKSGLPENASTLCLLPITLDTPMNRKWMPKADTSTWTSQEEQLRKEEKEREAEIARKKEKERLEKEQEKQRQEERKKLMLLSQERDRLKKLEEEREKEKREKLEKLEKLEKEKPKDPEKEKKKSKKEKKDKDRDKSKKDKKKEKKEKKKMKEKERNKPDEPQLFAPITPVLKIKPMEAPTAESPSTPKLVIKNIPKNPPAVKEEPAVPVLGFQPLRHGPARTPKPSAAKIEKKAKRPSGDQAHTPGPSSAKKPREKHPKVKSKEVIEADSDDNTPGIITETVGSYTDESGNKVWICPACGKQDDGSPMIGCDNCDDWYHWLCVGIKSEPGENQDWFCTRCVAKKQGLYLDGGASSKKKK